MKRTTVAHLQAVFVLLFAIVAVRQAYVQIVDAPRIAAMPYNPRHALLAAGRGAILASNGAVLAQTTGGTRVYPQGASLAQTVGYASARYGTSGIEDAYDQALQAPAASGDPLAQFEAIVRAVRGGSQRESGADVITTIVPSIQRELYADLAVHARGAGVVLDPRSGAVLALASVPSFDPNTLDEHFAQLAHNTQSPLLNRALNGLYPPGSTFKIVTASAALESGAVTMTQTWNDPGYIDIGNVRLHDDESEATGRQNITGAFALSSNVDFAQIALAMGVPTFYQYLQRWGIGGSPDFQLPVSADRVPPAASIVPGELAQMGFGQGALLMTPMQMALIAATIADEGSEPRPYIVRQVRRPDGAASTYGSSVLAQPISAQTAQSVERMMEAVVEYGTGTAARLPGVRVAGKTGTATNPFGAADSWFVCFAPARAPRVVVAVMVENAGYGAAVALPIARDVLRIALDAGPR